MAEGLRLDGITVQNTEGAPVVGPVDLHVPEGGVLALMGASGSGKTSALLAALDALPDGLVRTSGQTRWRGRPVPSGRAGRHWRRTRVGLLGQDPASDLHPLRPVASLVADGLPRGPRRAVRTAVHGALSGLGLDPGTLGPRRPGELSGGQAQRVALARAIIADPELLVLDEPTSGLDPDTVELVVQVLEQRRARPGRATLLITHDDAFAARVADEYRTLDAPDGPPPTETSPAGAPALWLSSVGSPPTGEERKTRERRETVEEPALEMDGVTITTPEGRPLLDRVHLCLHRGRALAILGPSGSGKSTLLRAATGLHPPAAGTVALDGRPLPPSLSRRGRKALGALQLVGQDPSSALNPAHRVGTALARPAMVLRGLTRAQARTETAALLERVGLSAEVEHALPGRLSGGQRQRVAIARALAARPRVLLADEVTSALDADSTEAVLDLLDSLRRESGLAVVMVTHERRVADRADRVLTLDPGRRALCEAGVIACGTAP